MTKYKLPFGSCFLNNIIKVIYYFYLKYKFYFCLGVYQQLPEIHSVSHSQFFHYFFLSLSPLFVGIHTWQWLLVPILQLPLEYWSGHNVNSQFTFTPSTGSDQKVGQKHQKDSIRYDTPQTNQICWLIFWPQKLSIAYIELVDLYWDQPIVSSLLENPYEDSSQ